MKKKHVIELSDPITKKQYGKELVTLTSTEVYKFNKTTAYKINNTGKNRPVLLLALKVSKGKVIPIIYYLDLRKSFRDNSDLLCLLNTRGDDFSEHVEATLELNDGTLKNVLWHKVSPTFYVDKKCKISEYCTKNKDLYGSSCLIYWDGDYKNGVIEVWYGKKIKKNEYSVKN